MNEIQRYMVGAWRAAGIEDGDMVLVHSALSRFRRRMQVLLKEDISPAQLLETILLSLGDNGTALFPLFNFDFCQGIAFDIRTSPSHMGALTEAARTRPDAVRTGHPIYSFAAIGKHAKEFSDVCNESGYGADSPFAKIRDRNGRIAVLDLPDQNSMTFYHHVEEMMSVPYRFHKTFTAPYTDSAGGTAERSFKIFVRDLDNGVETHVDPMGELLWNEGLYAGDRPGEGFGARSIKCEPLFRRTAEVITSGQAENLLFRYSGQSG